MISLDTEYALLFTESQKIASARDRAQIAFQQVTSGLSTESKWIGWQQILSDPANTTELAEIQKKAAEIRKDADIFIICGIGNSSPGAKAVIDALQGYFPDQKTEIIYAGHQVNGHYIDQLIHHLEQPNPDGSPKSACMNVISTTDSTLETALTFRILRDWFEQQYGSKASDRIIATAGSGRGNLTQMIEDHGYDKFTIPDDTGGSFTLLTPVWLLPLAVAGINIKNFLEGAADEYRYCEASPHMIIRYAALRYNFHRNRKVLDVIGTFEPGLYSFSRWVQQLLDEREEKHGKGIITTSVDYPDNLNSINKIIKQGNRNIIETLLVVGEEISPISVNQKENTGRLEYHSELPLHDFSKNTLKKTIEEHVKFGVPVIQINIKSLNASTLGGLICFYKLFSAVYFCMLSANPFDQPVVKNYRHA